MPNNFPFPEGTGLYHKLRIGKEGDLLRQRIKTSFHPEASTEDVTAKDYLPGEPRVKLNDDHICEYLQSELATSDLDKLSPYLWLVATQDSSHISSLTHQVVRGRNITVTEKPALHLVWIYDRVFIKPMPKYLLSHSFWQFYLINPNSRIPEEQRRYIARAALGFMRSYAHLVRHKSDFILATNNNHRLLPKNTRYSSFVKFIMAFEHIDDDSVSLRYKFGELRLSRLNFWTKIFLQRFTYYKVHGQYGAYFARFYGPILFIFALFSIVLNAMQVALAVDELSSSGPWTVFGQLSRGFSIFTIIWAVLVVLFFLSMLFLLSSREFVYAVKSLYLKRKIKADDGGVKD